MIIHGSKKLAAKLPDVSPTALEEASPLGSWHGHLFTLDRRQCVMFVHDETRYALFLPGLRKKHFAELGGKWFRELFTSTLAAFGCPDVQIRKVELALGPVYYDTAIDRSVQGSLRVVKQDLAVSCDLCHRPTSVYGKWLWPDKAMLEWVGRL